MSPVEKLLNLLHNGGDVPEELYTHFFPTVLRQGRSLSIGNVYETASLESHEYITANNVLQNV